MTRSRHHCHPIVRAVLFDFNGTIICDERLVADIYVELFAEEGISFTANAYAELAGLPDYAFFTQVFTDRGVSIDDTRLSRLIADRVQRYTSRIGSRYARPGVRDFITACAERVPVAIASGAYHTEIRHTLELVGLAEFFPIIVGIDHVGEGKPNPATFLRALEEINRAHPGAETIAPAEVLVVEDATAGVEAASAAGMQSLVIDGPAYDHSIVRADVITDRLDANLAHRLIGDPGARHQPDGGGRKYP